MAVSDEIALGAQRRSFSLNHPSPLSTPPLYTCSVMLRRARRARFPVFLAISTIRGSTSLAS